jgi:hypothetical protein
MVIEPMFQAVFFLKVALPANIYHKGPCCVLCADVSTCSLLFGCFRRLTTN